MKVIQMGKHNLAGKMKFSANCMVVFLAQSECSRRRFIQPCPHTTSLPAHEFASVPNSCYTDRLETIWRLLHYWQNYEISCKTIS